MFDIAINSKIFRANAKAGQHVAIADFHLSVSPGEFVCLVGPSGCGKTTLLNIIAGLDLDFDGTIDFDIRQQTLPTIGYVFQNPRLLPWRTVRENIELVAESISSSATIDELLGVMQLSQFQHVYPERLSLGMSRRVAIIRAFAVNPDLLLMDEPFVSLDLQAARQSRQLLLSLWHKRPHTVLFVTHDLREAIAIADRIIFLSPPPMKATADIAVTLPRHERDNEASLETFRQQFLQDYPELL